VGRSKDLPVDRQGAAPVALVGLLVAREGGDLGEVGVAHGDLPVHGTVHPLPHGERPLEMAARFVRPVQIDRDGGEPAQRPGHVRVVRPLFPDGRGDGALELPS